MAEFVRGGEPVPVDVVGPVGGQHDDWSWQPGGGEGVHRRRVRVRGRGDDDDSVRLESSNEVPHRAVPQAPETAQLPGCGCRVDRSWGGGNARSAPVVGVFEVVAGELNGGELDVAFEFVGQFPYLLDGGDGFVALVDAHAAQ